MVNNSLLRPNRFGRFQVPPIRLILILNAIQNPSLLLLSQSRTFYAWKDKRGPAAHSRVTLSPMFVRTSSPCFNSIGNLFEEEALRELEPGEHVVRLSYLPWFEWVFAEKKKSSSMNEGRSYSSNMSRPSIRIRHVSIVRTVAEKTSCFYPT